MTVSWHQAFVVGAHLLLTWVLTTISIPASAAEPAKVRIAFDTDLPVWVGQKVAFHVDLMSATFFSGTPTFDLPDLPGVVLMKVEARPVVSTERVDGDTYSVQRHQFVLFPQQSGTIMVPPFQARFAVAPGFGRPPVEQALMTDTLMGEVRMPPGTAGLSMLISTTDLTVDDMWSPALGDDHTVKVGDALTRTITRRAADVPAMALPPLAFAAHDGLGVYPKPPAVADSTQRGDFTGQRIETVTYMCEKAGTYTLPTLMLPWFDVDDEQLKHLELPAITLEVVANPRLPLDVPTSKASRPRSTARAWWRISGTIFVTLVAALLFWRFRRPLAIRLNAWRSCRTESPAASFARLQTACRSGNPAVAFNALMRWLDRTQAGAGVATVEQFVQETGDDELRAQAEKLLGVLFAPQSVANTIWSGHALYDRLAHVQKHRRHGHNSAVLQGRKTLPTLNPASTP